MMPRYPEARKALERALAINGDTVLPNFIWDLRSHAREITKPAGNKPFSAYKVYTNGWTLSLIARLPAFIGMLQDKFAETYKPLRQK